MHVSLNSVELGTYSNKSEADLQVLSADWRPAAYLTFSVASPLSQGCTGKGWLIFVSSDQVVKYFDSLFICVVFFK